MTFEIQLEQTTGGTRVVTHDDPARRLTEQVVETLDAILKGLLDLIDQAEKERLT